MTTKQIAIPSQPHRLEFARSAWRPQPNTPSAMVTTVMMLVNVTVCSSSFAFVAQLYASLLQEFADIKPPGSCNCRSV